MKYVYLVQRTDIYTGSTTVLYAHLSREGAQTALRAEANYCKDLGREVIWQGTEQFYTYQCDDRLRLHIHVMILDD